MGLIALDPENFITQATTVSTRGHSKKLFVPDICIDARKFSFSCRAIQIWNSLPEQVVSAPTINSFKARLNRYRSDFFID